MVNWYDLYPCNYNQDVKKNIVFLSRFLFELKENFYSKQKTKDNENYKHAHRFLFFSG
jgi:hypothetical protein